MENNTQKKQTYELSDKPNTNTFVSVSNKKFAPPSKKKSKTILGRLEHGVQIGKKAWVMFKLGLALAVGVGGGTYVYRQLHKSPEQMRQETKQKMQESKEAVEQAVQEDFGTSEAAKSVGEAAGKIAETGASHGGAVREWLIKKFQKTDE